MGRDIELLIEHLLDIKEKLGTMESRLESLDKNMAEHMRRTDLVEKQVDDLKRIKYLMIGAAAAAPSFLSKILEYIKHT